MRDVAGSLSCDDPWIEARQGVGERPQLCRIEPHVPPAVTHGTDLRLKLRHGPGKTLSRPQQALDGEQRDKRAIPLGKVDGQAHAAEFLAAKEYVALEQFVVDAIEAYGDCGEVKSEALRLQANLSSPSYRPRDQTGHATAQGSRAARG